MEVRIREATVSDIQKVLSVYASAGIDNANEGKLPVAEKTFEKMGLYPSYKVYVAESDNEVIGTFELLVMDNLAHGGAPSGVVEDVAVVPSVQGQGVGKAMMQFAMDECRRQRCYKMALSANAIRTGAHRFYELLGFKQHGVSFVVELSRCVRVVVASGCEVRLPGEEPLGKNAGRKRKGTCSISRRSSRDRW